METRLTGKEPHPQNRPPAFLNSFNLVRFLAAIHIVNGHLFERALISHDLPAELTVLLSSSASYSTSLFFVLSGIVLAYTRGKRADQATCHEDPFRLFLRRSMRGVPFLLIGAGLFAAKPLLLEGYSTAVFFQFLYSISLVSPFLFDTPSLNAPAWAMSVFVMGYFIDAYFGRIIGAQSTNRSLLAIGLMGSLLSVFIFICCVLLPVSPSYLPRHYDNWSLALHVFPLPRVVEMILGMFLGSLLYRHYWQIQAAFSRCLISNGIACSLIVLFNLACLALISRMPGHLAFLATHGLLLAPLSIMLLALAVNDGWVETLRLGRLTRFLGSLTLPIYLLHVPCRGMYALAVWMFFSDVARDSWIFMAGYFTFLGVFSYSALSLVNRCSIENVTRPIADRPRVAREWPVGVIAVGNGNGSLH